MTDDITPNDTMRRSTGVSEFQIKYGRLLSQLSWATFDCGTWHCLAGALGNNIINLRRLRDTSTNSFKQPEGLVAIVQEGKQAIYFEWDGCNAE